MGQFSNPSTTPVKTPDASLKNSPRYMDGYNTAFDNNVNSKTLDQDLQATRDYSANVNKYADNDTMDYYKGQSDALQHLSDQRKAQPKPVAPITKPSTPTMKQSTTANTQVSAAIANLKK